MAPTELPVREAAERPGFVLVAAAALTGGLLAGAAGTLAGIAWASRFMPNAELEALGPVLLGMAAGAWIGPGLLTWFALRTLGRRAAGPTGALLFAAVPAWGVVSFPSFAWLSTQMGPVQGIGDWVVPALFALVLFVPPALVSRWLVLHNEKVRAGREEN